MSEQLPLDRRFYRHEPRRPVAEVLQDFLRWFDGSAYGTPKNGAVTLIHCLKSEGYRIVADDGDQ